jgi:DNA-binding MarR family transcriptional regulator
MHIHLFCMESSRKPMLPCMCATLRRTTRIVTQLYEAEMRTTGLSSSQFTILQVLSLAAGITQKRLGEVLAMDSTSLTRTLAIMSRHGWIDKRRGQDRREWRFRLSRAGEKQLNTALPHWDRAQMRLRQLLRRSQASELMQLTDRVAMAIEGLASGDMQ